MKKQKAKKRHNKNYCEICGSKLKNVVVPGIGKSLIQVTECSNKECTSHEEN